MKHSTLKGVLLMGMSLFMCGIFSANAQLAFTDANTSLNLGGMYSGCAVTVTDVNFDGMDDILRMDQGHRLYLDLQNRDGSYTTQFLYDIGTSSAWAMTCADVDQNGWKDAVMDGDGGIIFVKLFGAGSTVTVTTSTLQNSGFFLQNATFADFNNDGWIDLFCCDDNAAAHMYLNDGTGNLNISTMVNFAVNPGVNYNGDPADSGNYGSAWIDFDNDGDLDLYVAHCRQSTSSPTDLRRINRMFVNDGNNNFTEQANAYGIDIGWQTWTSSFGDLDNDGDLDLVLTNHDHTSQIFQNDGTGHYTELLSTGFHTNAITPIESVVEDFDNDGFADILVTGSEWMYWKNNGDMTFTQLNGLFANNGMLSFATGDLNHDGFIDVYASYGDIYTSPSSFQDVAYLNNKNTNHFITFDLVGTASNKGAIGGRATIYGPWGAQVREVRAGESYGTCNSSQLHFGLGNNLEVDSAVIWFPSGNITRLYNLNANQFVNVVENNCSVAGNVISGPSIICVGQTITLTAATGFSSYLWSTGETTQSIQVSSSGSYNVLVSDGGTCTDLSPTLSISQNPDETPSISTSGDVSFCNGGSVTLTSSVAVAYVWSDGNTTQSIDVTTPGSYTVTITGACGQFTSDPVTVSILSSPDPIVSGASAVGPTSVVLSATGNDLYWYDSQTGGTLLGQGATFTTPVLSTPTTYWVENRTSYPGPLRNTGMTYHAGTLFSGPTTNGTIEFTVNSACTLKSVKVYTDSAGLREVQLTDASGTVLQYASVNIPVDSSRVNLNFALTPGTYRLTTNASVNQTTFNHNSPRLQRSSNGVVYPYVTPNNTVVITGSNQGANYYYYFYDWEVEEQGAVCTSDRVPVIADILNGIDEAGLQSGISIYPNPASGIVNVNLDAATPVHLSIYDASIRLVREVRFNAMSNQFNVEDLAAGVYQVKINKGENTYNYKLVVR
ncbi:MAG: VCBS repeat-containing protein [Bacteroidetes bacterium]|nr:VCBS repeat-containing protein [Bacteroidota bacterium]